MHLLQRRKGNQDIVQNFEVDVFLCGRRSELDKALACRPHKRKEVPRISDNLRRNEAHNAIGEASIKAEDRAVCNVCSDRYAKSASRPKLALGKAIFAVTTVHFLDEIIGPGNFTGLNQGINLGIE